MDIKRVDELLQSLERVAEDDADQNERDEYLTLLAELIEAVDDNFIVPEPQPGRFSINFVRDVPEGEHTDGGVWVEGG
jgi:hypothetical protein